MTKDLTLLGATAGAIAVAETKKGGREVQTLTCTATLGTFKLTHGAATTSALAFDATAAQVQTALVALSTIASATVTFSGGSVAACSGVGVGIAVTFTGSTVDEDAMTKDLSLLGATAGTIAVAETFKGGSEVQTLTCTATTSTIAADAQAKFTVSGLVTPPKSQLASAALISTTTRADVNIDGPSSLVVNEITPGVVTGALTVQALSSTPGVETTATVSFTATGAIPAGGFIDLELPGNGSWAILLPPGPNATYVRFTQPSRIGVMQGNSTYVAGPRSDGSMLLRVNTNASIATGMTVVMIIKRFTTPPAVRGAGVANITTYGPDMGTINSRTKATVGAVLPGTLAGPLHWNSYYDSPGTLHNLTVMFTPTGYVPVQGSVEFTLSSKSWVIDTELPKLKVLEPAGVEVSTTWDQANRFMLIRLLNRPLLAGRPVKLSLPAVHTPPAAEPAGTVLVTTRSFVHYMPGRAFTILGDISDGPTAMPTDNIVAAPLTGPLTWRASAETPGVDTNVTLLFNTFGAVPMFGRIVVTLPDAGWTFRGPQSCDVEVQTLTCTATTGTFKLTHGGQETTALAFGATATQVQAALVALSTIASATVTFSTGAAACSGAGVGIEVTFTGSTIDEALLTNDVTALAGGTITVVETKKGGAPCNVLVNATLLEPVGAAGQPSPRILNGTWSASSRVISLVTTGLKAHSAVRIVLQNVTTPSSAKPPLNGTIKTITAAGGLIDSPTKFMTDEFKPGRLRHPMLAVPVPWSFAPRAPPGASSTVSLSFNTTGAIPALGSLVMHVPPEWLAPGAVNVAVQRVPGGAVQVTSTNWDTVARTVTVVLSRRMPARTSFAISMTGLKLPPIAQRAAVTTVTTNVGPTEIIDESKAVAVDAVLGGAPAGARWDTFIDHTPGVKNNVTVSFTSAGAVPKNGSIVIVLPPVGWTVNASALAFRWIAPGPSKLVHGNWNASQRNLTVHLPQRSEVQTLTCIATTGTFKLVHGGQTTVALAFDATSTQVQTALVALSTIASATVSFSTGAAACSVSGVGMVITFTGSAATGQAPLTKDVSLLSSGGTITVAYSEVQFIQKEGVSAPFKQCAVDNLNSATDINGLVKMFLVDVTGFSTAVPYDTTTANGGPSTLRITGRGFTNAKGSPTVKIRGLIDSSSAAEDIAILIGTMVNSELITCSFAKVISSKYKFIFPEVSLSGTAGPFTQSHAKLKAESRSREIEAALFNQPTLNSVEPSFGSVGQTADLTISGCGIQLTANRGVTLDVRLRVDKNTTVESCTVVSSKTLTCKMPAFALDFVGEKSVEISMNNGADFTASSMKYQFYGKPHQLVKEQADPADPTKLREVTAIEEKQVVETVTLAPFKVYVGDTDMTNPYKIRVGNYDAVTGTGVFGRKVDVCELVVRDQSIDCDSSHNPSSECECRCARLTSGLCPMAAGYPVYTYKYISATASVLSVTPRVTDAKLWLANFDQISFLRPKARAYKIAFVSSSPDPTKPADSLAMAVHSISFTVGPAALMTLTSADNLYDGYYSYSPRDPRFMTPAGLRLFDETTKWLKLEASESKGGGSRGTVAISGTPGKFTTGGTAKVSITDAGGNLLGAKDLIERQISFKLVSEPKATNLVNGQALQEDIYGYPAAAVLKAGPYAFDDATNTSFKATMAERTGALSVTGLSLMKPKRGMYFLEVSTCIKIAGVSGTAASACPNPCRTASDPLVPGCLVKSALSMFVDVGKQAKLKAVASFPGRNDEHGTFSLTGGNIPASSFLEPECGVLKFWETVPQVHPSIAVAETFKGGHEVQTLNCTATGGTFSLTHGGQTTSALAFEATATQVQTALVALSTIVSATVSFSTGAAACSGTGVGMVVTFTGSNADEVLLTKDVSSLSSGGTITVAETKKGGREVQTLTCTATLGTFTLTHGGQTTSALAFDATATQVQAALVNLSTIASAKVSFSMGAAACSISGVGMIVTFTGSTVDEAPLTKDLSSLGTSACNALGCPNIDSPCDGTAGGVGGAYISKAPAACTRGHGQASWGTNNHLFSVQCAEYVMDNYCAPPKTGKKYFFNEQEVPHPTAADDETGCELAGTCFRCDDSCSMYKGVDKMTAEVGRTTTVARKEGTGVFSSLAGDGVCDDGSGAAEKNRNRPTSAVCAPGTDKSDCGCSNRTAIDPGCHRYKLAYNDVLHGWQYAQKTFPSLPAAMLMPLPSVTVAVFDQNDNFVGVKRDADLKAGAVGQRAMNVSVSLYEKTAYAAHCAYAAPGSGVTRPAEARNIFGDLVLDSAAASSTARIFLGAADFSLVVLRSPKAGDYVLHFITTDNNLATGDLADNNLNSCENPVMFTIVPGPSVGIRVMDKGTSTIRNKLNVTSAASVVIPDIQVKAVDAGGNIAADTTTRSVAIILKEYTPVLDWWELTNKTESQRYRQRANGTLVYQRPTKGAFSKFTTLTSGDLVNGAKLFDVASGTSIRTSLMKRAGQYELLVVVRSKGYLGAVHECNATDPACWVAKLNVTTQVGKPSKLLPTVIDQNRLQQGLPAAADVSLENVTFVVVDAGSNLVSSELDGTPLDGTSVSASIAAKSGYGSCFGTPAFTTTTSCLNRAYFQNNIAGACASVATSTVGADGSVVFSSLFIQPLQFVDPCTWGILRLSVLCDSSAAGDVANKKGDADAKLVRVRLNVTADVVHALETGVRAETLVKLLPIAVYAQYADGQHDYLGLNDTVPMHLQNYLEYSPLQAALTPAHANANFLFASSQGAVDHSQFTAARTSSNATGTVVYGPYVTAARFNALIFKQAQVGIHQLVFSAKTMSLQAHFDSLTLNLRILPGDPVYARVSKIGGAAVTAANRVMTKTTEVKVALPAIEVIVYDGGGNKVQDSTYVTATAYFKITNPNFNPAEASPLWKVTSDVGIADNYQTAIDHTYRHETQLDGQVQKPIMTGANVTASVGVATFSQLFVNKPKISPQVGDYAMAVLFEPYWVHQNGTATKLPSIDASGKATSDFIKLKIGQGNAAAWALTTATADTNAMRYKNWCNEPFVASGLTALVDCDHLPGAPTPSPASTPLPISGDMVMAHKLTVLPYVSIQVVDFGGNIISTNSQRDVVIVAVQTLDTSTTLPPATAARILALRNASGNNATFTMPSRDPMGLECVNAFDGTSTLKSVSSTTHITATLTFGNGKTPKVALNLKTPAAGNVDITFSDPLGQLAAETFRFKVVPGPAAILVPVVSKPAVMGVSKPCEGEMCRVTKLVPFGFIAMDKARNYVDTSVDFYSNQHPTNGYKISVQPDNPLMRADQVKASWLENAKHEQLNAVPKSQTQVKASQSTFASATTGLWEFGNLTQFSGAKDGECTPAAEAAIVAGENTNTRATLAAIVTTKVDPNNASNIITFTKSRQGEIDRCTMESTAYAFIGARDSDYSLQVFGGKVTGDYALSLMKDCLPCAKSGGDKSFCMPKHDCQRTINSFVFSTDILSVRTEPCMQSTALRSALDKSLTTYHTPMDYFHTSSQTVAEKSLSSDEFGLCVCEKGYQLGGQGKSKIKHPICAKCPADNYKAEVGNGKCTWCGASMWTMNNEGSSSARDCVCKNSFFYERYTNDRLYRNAKGLDNIRVRFIGTTAITDNSAANQNASWFNLTTGIFKDAAAELEIRVDAKIPETGKKRKERSPASLACEAPHGRFPVRIGHGTEPRYNKDCTCSPTDERPCVFEKFTRPAGRNSQWERKKVTDRCVRCPTGFMKFDLNTPAGTDDADQTNLYYSKASFDWIAKGKINENAMSQGATYCQAESENGAIKKSEKFNVYRPFRAKSGMLTQPGWWRLDENSAFFWKCDLQPGTVRQAASQATAGPLAMQPIMFKQYCTYWRQEGTWQERVCNDRLNAAPTPAPTPNPMLNGTEPLDPEDDCDVGYTQVFVADNAQCLKWETCFSQFPNKCPFANTTKHVNVSWETGVDATRKVATLPYSFEMSSVPWQFCGGTASNDWAITASRTKEGGASTAAGSVTAEAHAAIKGTTNGVPHFGTNSMDNSYIYPPLYWINKELLGKVVQRGYSANGLHTPPHPLHRPLLQVIPPACTQCKGGSGGGEDLCGPAYRGKLCAACQPNYGKSGKLCEPCGEPNNEAVMGLSMDKVVIVVMMFLATIVVSGMVWSTIKAGKDIERSLNEDTGAGYAGAAGSMKEAQLKVSLLAKMLVNYMQMTAFAKEIDIQWPAQIQQMFKTQETLSMVNTFSMSQIDCVLAAGKDAEMNLNSPGEMKLFFSSWSMYMSLPIIFIVIAVCFWTFRFLMARYVGKACFKKKLSFEQAKANMIITMLVLLFFAHPTIVKQILMMFECKVLGIDAQTGKEMRYLQSDYYVNCDSDEYKRYAIIGYLCMFGWALGIPLMAAKAINFNIKAIRYEFVGEVHPDYDEVLHFKKLKAISRFGFLFKGYEERDICPYWEVAVIMIRKTLMIILTVYLKDYPIPVRVLFGSLLIVFFLVLHVKYEPFDDDDLDSLETWSLLCSFLTLFLGLFFEVAKDYPSWMDPIAYTILAVNGFVFFQFGYHFLFIATSFARHKMKTAREAKLQAQMGADGISITAKNARDAAGGPPQVMFAHRLFGKPVPPELQTLSPADRERSRKENRGTGKVQPEKPAANSGPPQPEKPAASAAPQQQMTTPGQQGQMVPVQMVPVQMVPMQMVPVQMVQTPGNSNPTPGQVVPAPAPNRVA
jgi:hypothetical protein